MVGACMARGGMCGRGHAWQGGMHGKGRHVWHGGVHGRGCAWQGHAWQGHEWQGAWPPVNRMTDRCKNITLPQLRCGQ